MAVHQNVLDSVGAEWHYII